MQFKCNNNTIAHINLDYRVYQLFNGEGGNTRFYRTFFRNNFFFLPGNYVKDIFIMKMGVFQKFYTAIEVIDINYFD